jgi:predicted MFS family arabinose efflux permease
MAIGLSAMALGLYALPSASWMWPFLLIMVPVSWGSGMNATATYAQASRLTPADEQGGVFGVMNAMQGLGRIFGPLLGTLVFAKAGYRAPYLVAAACMALALVLALLLPRPTESA